MNNRSRHWLIAGAALAAVWLCVWIVMHETDHLVSWPEKVVELMEESPWNSPEEGNQAARQEHLSRVITNMVRLDASQRKRLREDHQDMVDRFFASLTEAEQKEYVNRTVEVYFEMIAKGLKLMSAEERKRMTGRIRSDVKSLRGQSADGDRLAKQDQEMLDFMIGEDPVFFLRELPVKAKMELAPVIEEMQSRVQGLRR